MEGIAIAMAALVALFSIQPLLNILSAHQIMNTSFDPLDLVNTYGAFGAVGKERFNVVFEGTDSYFPDETATWKPYPYKGLPVALDKRPPQIAPYQLQLDWQMWFAAMGTPNEYPWTLESHLEIAAQRSAKHSASSPAIHFRISRRVMCARFGTTTNLSALEMRG